MVAHGGASQMRAHVPRAQGRGGRGHLGGDAQLMLPLLLAMDATTKGLLAFVQQMGMAVLSELLAADAASIAGPKGTHARERTHRHWGTTRTLLCFGGRNVSIERPRVRGRGKGNKEVELPTIEALREGDPLCARVMEQVLVGVSTRGYERSLEPIDPELDGRGASKSNASRALIDATTEKLAEFVSRKLDDVDLVAMFVDGIEFARRTMIVALGVTIDGTKVPLGLWGGSTENAVVATSLLQSLVERGCAWTSRCCSSSMAARACCSATARSCSGARCTR
jgi:transposase-like protein